MLWTEQTEVRPRRKRARCQMHQVDVRDVAVGKDDLVDVLVTDQLLQRVLRMNRNAVRIACARECGGIAPAGDPGDLRRSEANHIAVGAVAKVRVEHVEVAAGRAQDEDAFGP